MKHKILSVLLTVLMSVVTSVASALGTKIDGIQYVLYKSNMTATVTYYSTTPSVNKNAYAGEIVIPENITYGGAVYRVIEIGEYAFRGCSDLISIFIPESIISIETQAFQDCTSLTSVSIPDCVTTIGNNAFQGCKSLLSATIGNGKFWTFGKSVFYGCSALTSVVIGDGINSIPSETFYNCNSLTSIIIPNNVTYIGDSAFYGCTGLTSITIGDNVSGIGDAVFYGCSGLISVIIGNSVTSIPNKAFQACSNLSNITIPESVKSIDDYAFAQCRRLTSITIPEGVTSIGKYTFWTTGLTSLTIPESVSAVGEKAFATCYDLASVRISTTSGTKYHWGTFDGCSSLKNVYITDLAGWCTNSYGNLFGNPYHLFDENQEISDLIIPTSVTSIGNSAFRGCAGLTSVTIPENVTSIGDYAFSDCTKLTSVSISSGVANIGSAAFDGCGNLAFIICKNETPPTTCENAFPATIGIIPPTSLDVYKAASGWNKLEFNKTIRQSGESQSTIELTPLFNNLFTNYRAALDGKEYVATNGIIKITGLAPNKKYSIETKANYEDWELLSKIEAITASITLNKPTLTNATNTTITVKKPTYDVGDADVVYAGFDGYGEKDEVTVTGLYPGEYKLLTYRITTRDGSDFYSEEYFQSKRPYVSGFSEVHSASSVTLRGKLYDRYRRLGRTT